MGLQQRTDLPAVKPIKIANNIQMSQEQAGREDPHRPTVWKLGQQHTENPYPYGPS